MRTRVFCCAAPAALLGLALAAAPEMALAGPPLICHAFEIGNAKSLPWTGSEWRDVDKSYDLNRLVNDTLALLTAETPVLVRMETMRRATIYAVWARVDHKVGLPVKDPKIAEELLEKVMARAKDSPQALFDAGYLIASYEQTGYQSSKVAMSAAEAYAMVRKAAAQTGNAEMEFAAAIITKSVPQGTYKEHLERATAGAKVDALLAKNLAAQFGER